MATLLTSEELDRALDDLSDWRLVDGAIRTHIEAADFRAAVALIGEIADVAEEMDHHPDIDLRWRNLDVALATHSAGGITDLDVTQAQRIVELAQRTGAELSPPTLS